MYLHKSSGKPPFWGTEQQHLRNAKSEKYPILYYTILYYIILYYTILYYTILYYTILCFIIL